MMLKKIAFIGSVGTGKTTIIEQLSSIETLNTDVKSSVDIGKEMTTVGIDYGKLIINDELSLALYGVPGQRKFSMVWDYVKDGLWAIVILIKNNDEESISEMNYLIDYYEINKSKPCVIGITHSNESSIESTTNALIKILDNFGLNIPIYSIDARTQNSAMLIMETIIAIEENN